MEKRFLKTLLLGSFILLAASCGKKEEDKSTGVDSYIVVGGSLSQADSEAIAGDAVLRFESTFPGVTSHKGINIKGNLAPSGYVSVIFNSDDLNMSDAKGVIFKLSRSTDPLATSCTATVSVQGVTAAVSNTRLAYFNCYSFDLFIEVHNTPTANRILVWRKELMTYSIANADVDSSSTAHFQTSYPASGGQGIFAGLKLHSATITTARMGDADVVSVP